MISFRIIFSCLSSLVLACYGLEKASQIHISYGQSHSSMVIMWSTRDEYTCFVNYGLSVDAMTQSEPSKLSALQYSFANSLKFIHRAELKNLDTDTTYDYKIVCEMANDTSETPRYSFKTLNSEPNRSVNVLVYGDMGAISGIPSIHMMSADVTSGEYESIWHVGDLAYNLDSNYGAVGDLFMNRIEPLATRLPYMTSPGNHELANELHHYRMRFSMPGTSWPMEKNELWYSYDIGPVHFISYSTEVYFTDNQNHVCEQFDWLLKDLMKANKNRHIRPWIVAMGHRPMYCSNSNSDDCTGRIFGYMVKYGLEDLFYAQGVDLVIQAHEHSYERLWPVYKSEVIAKNYLNPRAPVQIITGAAGTGEGIDPMGTPDPWSAFVSSYGSEHSYGRLKVANSTHLYFEQVRVKTSSIIDSFWIVQNSHGPNVEELDCTQPLHHRHASCSCPPPFHYTTILIVTGVFLFFAILFCILGCCACCQKQRSRTFDSKKRCCDWFKSHKHRHIPLLSEYENEDFDLVDPRMTKNVPV